MHNRTSKGWRCSPYCRYSHTSRYFRREKAVCLSSNRKQVPEMPIRHRIELRISLTILHYGRNPARTPRLRARKPNARNLSASSRPPEEKSNKNFLFLHIRHVNRPVGSDRRADRAPVVPLPRLPQTLRPLPPLSSHTSQLHNHIPSAPPHGFHRPQNAPRAPPAFSNHWKNARPPRKCSFRGISPLPLATSRPHQRSLARISSAGTASRENANNALPKSLSEAPMWYTVRPSRIKNRS